MKEQLRDYPQGEDPGIGMAELYVENRAGENIEENARQFKEEKPHILDHLKSKKLDGFLVRDSRGFKLLVGTGIVLTATALIAAFEIQKHRK